MIDRLLAAENVCLNNVLLFLLLISGTVLILWFCAKIKKVEIGYSDSILISNYHKVINVQLQDIKSISGCVYFRPEVIWFSLNRPSSFGKKIIFLAPLRSEPGFDDHPIIKELKDLVSLSKSV